MSYALTLMDSNTEALWWTHAPIHEVKAILVLLSRLAHRLSLPALGVKP